MQVSQKRTISARIPAKTIQQTGNRIGRDAARRRPVGAERRPYVSHCPGCCLALIETEHTANFWVDLELAKIRRPFGPSHRPAYSGDEIALVNAIPCPRSN